MSGINCQLSVCIVQEQNTQISHKGRIDSGLSINKPTASLSCCWEVILLNVLLKLPSIYIRQRLSMRMNEPTEYIVEQNAIFYFNYGNDVTVVERHFRPIYSIETKRIIRVGPYDIGLTRTITTQNHGLYHQRRGKFNGYLPR